MTLRWLTPLVLCALLWLTLAGVWLHDWKTIVGSLVAFAGVCLAGTEET